MRTSVNRHKDLTELSRKAFESHVITKRAEGRWLIQRLYADGVPRSDYAAEIVSLWWGALLVGGDINHVIFARYSGSNEAKVAWIGGDEEVTSYILEKATIGMEGPLLVWEKEEARVTLLAYCAQRKKDDPEEYAELEEAYKEVLDDFPDTWEAAAEALWEIDSETEVDLRVPDSRVYYAHAAVRKLHLLLEEEEE
jgi:hypothetical protein